MISIGANYSGVDISEEMLRYARLNLNGLESIYHVANNKLPFEEDLFDIVLSITVIHHNYYDEHEKIIAEIARVTKKRGPCAADGSVRNRKNKFQDVST